ncbi:hypothetical protein TBR22_A41630 [Luteitalea sp. TBR-22]|nr:hypothetical protein TBR22_A41630 [Luteitalea sp. TBR-22]
MGTRGTTLRTWLAAAVCVAAGAGAAQAQPYAVREGSVTGGGGTSSGGGFTAYGALAPTASNASSGGGFTVEGGPLTDPAIVLAPPTITTILPQQTTASVAVQVTFIIGDAETPPTALTLQASADAPALVPPTGLALTGTGTSRTLTITPLAGQSGSTRITVTVTDGDGLKASTTFTLDVAAPPTYTSFLAEGATSSFFDTRLAILNPGDADTMASLSFLRNGQPPVPLGVAVPARTRVTIWPKTLPALAEAEFSTVVTSDVPLVVDRTMTWGAGNYGAHAETATSSPSAVWYLAEGATHNGFALFYLLQNPSDAATSVRVRYLRAAGGPLEKVYPLPARSRTNIWVNVEEFPGLGKALAAAEVSAVIESLDATPFIVERAMYRSTPERTFDAGHESMAVPAPATRWFLAEGATGPYFDEFVLIANPTSIDATVELTYLLDTGQSYGKTITAPANARTTVWVDNETFPGIPGTPLGNVAVSTTVASTNGVPLVVERAMWWPGDSTSWQEAHNSSGAVHTGTLWALAEGETGGPNATETYVLVANTSATAGTARVTVLFEDGTPAVTGNFPLAPRSRTDVVPAVHFPATAGKRFSMLVESIGDTPAQIVVERAMYSNAGGVTWAAGTNALATRLR